MSTEAQAILAQFKTLPDAERREVCEEIKQLQSRRGSWAEQEVKLRQLQVECADRGLLQILLDERAKERAQAARS